MWPFGHLSGVLTVRGELSGDELWPTNYRQQTIVANCPMIDCSWRTVLSEVSDGELSWRVVWQQIVHAELSAANCPWHIVRGRIVHSVLSNDELSSTNCSKHFLIDNLNIIHYITHFISYIIL